MCNSSSNSFHKFPLFVVRRPKTTKPAGLVLCSPEPRAGAALGQQPLGTAHTVLGQQGSREALLVCPTLPQFLQLSQTMWGVQAAALRKREGSVTVCRSAAS